MGTGFKMLGKGFAETLLATTNNPFAGLFIGIFTTSLVQSSSCTTAITVGLVASGAISMHNSIPIIMGANIGTAVTSTIVSLAHIARKAEFRRAFAGSVVSDVFNMLAVVVILPLEIKFRIIEKLAHGLTNIFVGAGGIKLVNPLKIISQPVVKSLVYILGKHPILITITGLVFLFLSLYFFTRAMRDLTTTKAEKYLNEEIFSSMFKSFIAGLVLTAVVQSSSVTISLLIPLIGAGIISLEAYFPYVLGADIGTTFDTLLAGLVTTDLWAIATAFAHVIFNLLSAAIFYPLRKIPIGIAKALGRITTKTRIAAIIYIIVMFYVLPLVLVKISSR